MKSKSIQRIILSLLCIPGGALIGWAALTGIQFGDTIYRFPYFIILGGVLVLGGIINAINGLLALARRSNMDNQHSLL